MTDTTKVNQYQDQIVEAVGTIVRKAVEAVSFDKTITCTITNDNNRDEGEYVVSDGSTTFNAYTTDTTLRKGNSVYVTIPEGNYDNQKLIVGKKKSNSSNVLTYQEPFNKILDLTNNLVVYNTDIENSDKNEFSIISNGATTTKKITSHEFADDQQYTGFDYIGLKAAFRSKIINAISGDYGLEVHLRVKNYLTEQEKVEKQQCKKRLEELNNITNKTEEDQKEIDKLNEKINFLGGEAEDIEYKIVEYTFRLNTEQMFGNPYSFYVYQEQQALFPIGKNDILLSYDIYLYQDGSFIDNNGTLINKTNTDELKDIDGVPIADDAEQADIFVSYIYMCAGLEAADIGNEYLNLYTFDSLNYHTEDIKTVNLRWMRKNNKGVLEDVVPSLGQKDNTTFSLFAVADETAGETETASQQTTIENEIRWYRYQLGAPAADQFCGVYWTRIKNEDEDILKQIFFKPSLNYQEEKIKVITVQITKNLDGNTIDEKVISRSEVLIFNNEIDASMYSSIEGVEGIYLSFDDGSNGDYYLYNQGNQLIDKSQGQKVRMAKLWEKLNEKASEVNLEDCSTITWKLPLKNTMLSFSNIPEKFKDSEFMELEKTTSINYKIKTQYNPNATNNTITCIIRKNENTYLVNKKIDFGRMGTNGTDYTLVIETEHNAILMNDSSKSYIYKAKLYDNIGKDITGNQEFEWDWYIEGNGLQINKMYTKDETGQDKELYSQIKIGFQENTTSVNGLYILQLSYNNLTTYLPIALTASEDYQYNGPTEIVYPTTGELEYCNLPCSVINSQNNSQIAGTWDLCYYEENTYYSFNDLTKEKQDVEKDWTDFINSSEPKLVYKGQTYTGKTEEDYKQFSSNHIKPIENKLRLFDYFGKLSNNYFKPIGYYIKSEIFYGIVLQGVWIQPILVLQNKYPSTVVNQWDGVVPTINTEEGYILTPVIAAGKKDGDNTFSGVMIGDMGKLETDSELSRNTGIYGFHQGAVSYAFKEDGTAFIGKSGGGRLYFDGTEATIKSTKYGKTLEGGKGMLIDFDDGIIHLRNSGDSKNVNLLPFNINDTTTISWDGTLTSRDVNLTGGKLQSGKLELSLNSSNSRFEFFNNTGITNAKDFGLIIQAKTEGITNMGTFGFVDLIFKSSASEIYWPKIGTDESGALNIKTNTISLSNTSGETTIKGVLQASDSTGSAIYANFA